MNKHGTSRMNNPQGFQGDIDFWGKGMVEMEVSIAMGVPQNGWFVTRNPIKMDDLGVPLFWETSIWQSWETPLDQVVQRPSRHILPKKNQRRIVPRLPQKGNRRQENQDVIGWVRGESGCRWWYPNHSTSVEIRKVGINDVVLCEKNRGISENFMLQHHIPCFLNGMKCGLNHVNPSFADSCRCEEEAEEDEHVFPQWD